MKRRELEWNGSRDGGSDGGSSEPSSTVGFRLLDQDLEIAEIDAQLVRESERGELPRGNEAVDSEAAPKAEVRRRLLWGQKPTHSRAQLVSGTAPVVILGRAATLRAGPCMHVSDSRPLRQLATNMPASSRPSPLRKFPRNRVIRASPIIAPRLSALHRDAKTRVR